jgi:hypothetical protein
LKERAPSGGSGREKFLEVLHVDGVRGHAKVYSRSGLGESSSVIAEGRCTR